MKYFLMMMLTLTFSALNAQSSKTKKNPANTSSLTEIQSLLDGWHRAAAEANAEVFFAAMADSSIYIGTDATERWTKSEFKSFAMPYFNKGKAWDFKPYDRDLHLSPDGKHAWFSELLNTWMGVCRGSGILSRSGRTWKIEQYHLSVTVPNDAIKQFIDLVNNFNQSKK